jgi:2-polyprenyl-6-hydroxyphenyl methylase/3-demethylubiquinone-9 3-methyltransferase
VAPPLPPEAGRAPSVAPAARRPEEALSAIRAGLQPGGDTAYFQYHERRFRRHLETLSAIGVAGARILDVGSHYLHLGGALRLLGAEVTALDVGEFQRLPFVAERAARLGVATEVVRDLGAGDFLPGTPDDSYDLVVFCEILEHITFNPVAFWRRVHALLRPGGVIYITTPNALRLPNLLPTLQRAVLLRGIGIDVEAILTHVTYGHHWKEYSAGEIRTYFARLSPDFSVEVRPYHYRQSPPRASALKRAGVGLVRVIGNSIPAFREELEVIVRLRDKSPWRLETKRYED